MCKHISPLTADGWKAEGEWEENKLMIESMHNFKSQMMEEMRSR